jgi:hypothetical protein
VFDHIVAPELAFTHGFADGIVAGLKQSTQFVPGSRCREFCQVDVFDDGVAPELVFDFDW